MIFMKKSIVIIWIVQIYFLKSEIRKPKHANERSFPIKNKKNSVQNTILAIDAKSKINNPQAMRNIDIMKAQDMRTEKSFVYDKKSNIAERSLETENVDNQGKKRQNTEPPPTLTIPPTIPPAFTIPPLTTEAPTVPAFTISTIISDLTSTTPITVTVVPTLTTAIPPIITQVPTTQSLITLSTTTLPPIVPTITTTPYVTQPTTTLEPIAQPTTTRSGITQPATTIPPSTPHLTTQPITTKIVTTKPPATLPPISQPSTTHIITTQGLTAPPTTTLPPISQSSTTHIITTQGITVPLTTTLPPISQSSTTQNQPSVSTVRSTTLPPVTESSTTEIIKENGTTTIPPQTTTEVVAVTLTKTSKIIPKTTTQTVYTEYTSLIPIRPKTTTKRSTTTTRKPFWNWRPGWIIKSTPKPTYRTPRPTPPPTQKPKPPYPQIPIGECPEEVESIGCFVRPKYGFKSVLTKQKHGQSLEEFFCECGFLADQKEYSMFLLSDGKCFSSPKNIIYDNRKPSYNCINDAGTLCTNEDTYCQGKKNTASVYLILKGSQQYNE